MAYDGDDTDNFTMMIDLLARIDEKLAILLAYQAEGFDDVLTVEDIEDGHE